MMLLVAIVIGAKAAATEYKGDFTDGQVIMLSQTNVAAASSWITLGSSSAGKVTVSEPESVSNMDCWRVKQWSSRYLEFWVTGVSKLTFYANHPGLKSGAAKDTRIMKATVNQTSETSPITLVEIKEGATVTQGSGDVTLDPTVNNKVRVYATGDMDLYAMVLTVPAATDKPEAPTFNPEAGNIPAESTVTISSLGATTILYQWGATAIGQTGDWTGAATYSADNKPVVPAVGSANNVLSVKASNTYGDTYGSATYTITNPVVANPVLPATGSFNGSKSIEITCATSEATIQYSFDNSTWNNYTGAFSITATTTVYAKATKSGYVNSDVVSATYTKLDPGTDGNVEDLTAVSAGYTFIADDVTGGVSRITPGNKLYGDGKIYINGVANSKTDKGSSTIGGNSYYNSINLSSGYVAFKTDGPVKVKIYGGNNSSRNFKVGTADDDDKYGEAPTGQIAWTVFIPEAATVYIKQKTSGDYCLAGLEVSDAETVTLNAKGFATYSSSYDFEYFGADAYGMELTATSLSGTKVTTGKIKAGEGILFKGEAGAKVYIVDTTGAAALENNSLIGTTDINNEVISSVGYVNKYALNGDTFKKFTGALVANKAFFGTNEPISSNSLDLVFDGATAVEAIAEANEADAEVPVKVIKNGQLYIGNYNVAGARVK